MSEELPEYVLNFGPDGLKGSLPADVMIPNALASSIMSNDGDFFVLLSMEDLKWPFLPPKVQAVLAEKGPITYHAVIEAGAFLATADSLRQVMRDAGRQQG